MRIVILYDNVAQVPFREGWGFSAFVEIGERRILFDCGADRLVLAHNAKLLGIDFATLTDVFLSHSHCDHVGGLSEVLKAAKGAIVWAPSGMHGYLRTRVRKVNIMKRPKAMGDGLYSTGTLGKIIREQGLVLSSCGQRVLLTGCAHPGVDRMVMRACSLVGAPLSLVLGGFHLEGASPARLEGLARRLSNFTEALAPGHCTGEEAMHFLCSSFPKATPLVVGQKFAWESKARG